MDKKTFKETSIAEIISITGGILGGLGLAKFTGTLEKIPGLLILIPAFLEMRGNISGSLASRLGTYLHLGKIKPFKRNEILDANISASLLLSISTSLFIGLFAIFMSYLIKIQIHSIKIILISILSGVLSSFLMLFLTIFTSFLLYSKGYDPDNIMGPYVTTIGDVVSILTIVLVAGMFI